VQGKAEGKGEVVSLGWRLDRAGPVWNVRLRFRETESQPFIFRGFNYDVTT
jgi:hypothetical protein